MFLDKLDALLNIFHSCFQGWTSSSSCQVGQPSAWAPGELIQTPDTHMFPEEEGQDGSSQLGEEDEEDEHEELRNDKKRNDASGIIL